MNYIIGFFQKNNRVRGDRSTFSEITLNILETAAHVLQPLHEKLGIDVSDEAIMKTIERRHYGYLLEELMRRTGDMEPSQERDRLVELTGTPSPNGLADLWAQIFLLDGGDGISVAHNAKTLDIYPQYVMDVMLPYVESLGKAGKPIEYATDGRIKIEKS